MGPSTYARVVEITSGRAISQQGLAATCKDLAHEGPPEAQGGFWSGAWVRKSYEGGVTPSEATQEVALARGNALSRQRSPGHSVVMRRWDLEDMAGPPVEPPLAFGADMTGPPVQPFPSCSPVVPTDAWRGSGQTMVARGGCEPALKLPPPWAGPLAVKWRAEPRSEPDSGKPTVRDRRGALRIVTMGAGLRAEAKATEMPPDPSDSALKLYPDNGTYGSMGGCWKRSAPRV